ncbi:MAG: hypothetical protein B6U94_08720 [Thermofilum sp. ex4484_79]|nr:MAG: hypothetical protein B6U94_08720 [Thermofilum sp. ex4484_79]
MIPDFLIYLALVWCSSLYISLSVISTLQYRIVTFFKEYWHLLLAVIYTYTIEYLIITCYYTYNIAMYGRIPATVGNKSIPGLLGLIFASFSIWTLIYIISYVLSNARPKIAMMYISKNPVLLALIGINIVFLLKVFVSGEDAIYAYTVGNTNLTVVYSDTAILLGSLIVLLLLYPIYLIFKRIPSIQTFKMVCTPLKIVGIVFFVQVLSGEIAILLSTKLRTSFYPIMNSVFLLASLFSVSYFYVDLINVYKQLICGAPVKIRNTRTYKEIDRIVTPEISGRILVKILPEEDYSTPLKKWINDFSKKRKVIIVASPVNPLIKASYDNEDSILRLYTVTTGLISHRPNTLPISNLSLVANAIVNVSANFRNSVLIIDNLVDFIMINSIKEIYLFLKQITEILSESTIIAILNWKALSEKDYATLASLFEKIYQVKAGKIIQVKNASLTV